MGKRDPPFALRQPPAHRVPSYIRRIHVTFRPSADVPIDPDPMVENNDIVMYIYNNSLQPPGHILWVEAYSTGTPMHQVKASMGSQLVGVLHETGRLPCVLLAC